MHSGSERAKSSRATGGPLDFTTQRADPGYDTPPHFEPETKSSWPGNRSLLASAADAQQPNYRLPRLHNLAYCPPPVVPRVCQFSVTQGIDLPFSHRIYTATRGGPACAKFSWFYTE